MKTNSETPLRTGTPIRGLLTSGLMVFALVTLGAAPAAGQEHESTSEAETHDAHSGHHEFHANHFGGFLGFSLREGSNEAAATLGLEYTRQFTPKWGVTGFVELVSSRLERDVILAAGVTFYPVKGLSLLLAPGIEQASKQVEHSGHLEEEDELEFLLRVGAGYGFPLTPQANLGPTVFVDVAGGKVTTVLGFSMIVGF